MEMIVKEEFLKNLNLNIEEIFILNCAYYDEQELLQIARKRDCITDEAVTDLLDKEAIIECGGVVMISEHYKKAMFESLEKDKTNKLIKLDLKKFVDEYRELFPKGNNYNGYPYRGDRQGCLKKMARFIKLNPDYTPEIIIAATNKYINEKKKDNYDFMHLAHYFIEKNGVSLLGSFCEHILDSGESEKDKGFSNIINF